MRVPTLPVVQMARDLFVSEAELEGLGCTQPENTSFLLFFIIMMIMLFPVVWFMQQLLVWSCSCAGMRVPALPCNREHRQMARDLLVSELKGLGYNVSGSGYRGDVSESDDTLRISW